MSVLKRFRKAAQKDGEQQVQAKPKKLLPTYEGVGSIIRSDEYGNEYVLTGEQAAELAKLNAEIDDNSTFWLEFRKLRIKHGILPNRRTSWADTAYTPKPVSTSYKPYGWTDPTKKKSFMSEWWSGWSGWGGSWGGTSRTGHAANQLDMKLAVAKRAMDVILSVIDDSGHRMAVRYSEDGDHPVNYTDMSRNTISISAKPMRDNKLTDGPALDIMSGEMMHEASHSKYTRTLLKRLEEHFKNNTDDPQAIAALSLNLAEDVRIESLTSEEFPGFAGYFDALLDYMWESGGEVPEHYGPDLNSKFNAAIKIVRWEDKIRAVLSGPEWDPEIKWWTEWRDDYTNGRADEIQTVERALAHLRAATQKEQDKGTAKGDERSDSGQSGQASNEMDERAKAEAALQDLNAKIRVFIHDNGGLGGFCTHRDKGEGDHVSAGANETIGQLVDEEVEWYKPDNLGNANRTPPPVVVTKPPEDSRSKGRWDGKADPLVAKYRAALVFRPDKEIHSTKLLKRGKVDPTQLYRWAVDDPRMFMEKGRKVDPRANVFLLVDLSGSMAGGGKLRAAQQLTKLFVIALNDLDGVTPRVYGHTGDYHVTGPDVFRLWERGDPLSRIGLISTLPHSNNYDGYAIEYVGKQLKDASRNGEQRLLIVLSDGYPAGTAYGGPSAEAHVRAVVDNLRSKYGIRTLQIAIDPDMEPERQARMFPEFIPFHPSDSLSVVPKKLTKWLEKVL